MAEEVFSEFELAEDVQEFVTASKDVSFKDPKMKGILLAYDKSTLLKVTKSISSPTVIHKL